MYEVLGHLLGVLFKIKHFIFYNFYLSLNTTVFFCKVLYHFGNIEFKYYYKTERSTTSIKMWEDLYPYEVVVSVLIDSSFNIFGNHTGEPIENLKYGLAFFRKCMTLLQTDQPRLEIGLNNK